MLLHYMNIKNIQTLQTANMSQKDGKMIGVLIMGNFYRYFFFDLRVGANHYLTSTGEEK